MNLLHHQHHKSEYEIRVVGPERSLQPLRIVSSLVRQVKGSERGLSQQINCYASNAGTGSNSLGGRLADSQCCFRGRVAVVVRA